MQPVHYHAIHNETHASRGEIKVNIGRINSRPLFSAICIAIAKEGHFPIDLDKTRASVPDGLTKYFSCELNFLMNETIHSRPLDFPLPPLSLSLSAYSPTLRYYSHVTIGG